MKKSTLKLKLFRETIHSLEGPDIRRVRGASPTITYTQNRNCWTDFSVCVACAPSELFEATCTESAN